MGARVVTENGIICQFTNNKRRNLVVPHDRLIRQSDYLPLSPGMKDLQESILNGQFETKGRPLITTKEAHTLEHI